MRSSLSLQWSLYRHQQKQIGRTVAGGSAAFRRYQAHYRRATRSFRRPVSLAKVHARISRSDVVYVGDYHTLKAAQQAYLELVEHGLGTGRRVVLALEFVEGRHQRTLDRYLAGKLADSTFLTRIGHPYRGGFDIWPHFLPIFELARARDLDVIGIDRRATGPRSLQQRDAYAAAQIARAAAAADRPLVLVLMGQFHIAPRHLPRCVHEALGSTERSHLIVYQNAEGAYWELARQGHADRYPAVEIGDDEFCLITASPVVCQRSFLDYVEAESGDAPLEEPGLTSTFRHLARDIGRLTGIEVKKLLREVTVVTAGDLELVEQLGRRARFSAAELETIRKHILARESAYIPRARLAWLASLSLNHAAEEAAHFVRHAAVGEAMERARPRADAFWARCLEEALGFFGSKLVNPARRCTPLDEWMGLFERGGRDDRRVAAFVLALASVEFEGPEVTRRLLPLSSVTLFNSVSHAMGYLLGEDLFRAFEAGALNRRDVKALFTDPFDAPEATWRRLTAQVRRPSGPRRRRRRPQPTAAPRARSAA